MTYDNCLTCLVKFRIPLVLIQCLIVMAGCQDKEMQIASAQVKVSWETSDEGWKIDAVEIKDAAGWKHVGTPSGEHTLIYSPDKPDSTVTVFKTVTGVAFPEPVYHYQKDVWADATRPVALNTAGDAFHFFPAKAVSSEGKIDLSFENELAVVSSTWQINPEFSTDIMVSQTLIAKKDGYYSLASPALTTIAEKELAWATVPGHFQSGEMQDNFVSAYAYGHGVPRLPVLYRERSISTLTSIIDTDNGASLAVIPAPGLARDPWQNDRRTHHDWHVGISHMNRKAQLSPTLYSPVLGEPHSRMKAGDTLQYEFRFSVRKGNWYDNLVHAIKDVYQFGDGLALRSNEQSLSDRIRKMHRYLTDTKTSMWQVEQFEGVRIGAQSYLGGVVGSQRDAMKNADYGAMWMLAKATDDPFLKKQVLPFALNFKLKQQETAPGFFQGAAMGQYYLAKRKMFVEEWGEFVEPISLTYYMMLDIGNLLLFEPENTMLRERLRMGADLLLQWQNDDGSWEIAYDGETHEPLFKDIKDLRPTFYGLVVAYKLLKDEKYLEGAVKGADWLIANGVDKGHFIGVCGDARYAPDFATGQTAQALLDLYAFTKDEKHKDAAIRAARIYTTSVYTHPIPSHEKKLVKGVEKEDWEIAQAGLSFEHGGNMGSAQQHGPILLASHTGLFIRMFQLTGDSLFADMARSAAVGRDAFVDPATSVASYYWSTMNRGAGPFPHHAWWQIGWITDYLMAEANLRSNGKVVFPRGFVTPKVGPHQTYGFSPGNIFGEQASLIIREGLLDIPDPNVEFITAQSTSGQRIFVVLMNARNEFLESSITIDLDKIRPGLKAEKVTLLGKQSMGQKNEWDFSLEPYGLSVFAIDYK